LAGAGRGALAVAVFLAAVRWRGGEAGAAAALGASVFSTRGICWVGVSAGAATRPAARGRADGGGDAASRGFRSLIEAPVIVVGGLR
ncbi:MAG: hypothetical protein ACR2FL_01030, partial [Nocardioidaceae bacterium]